MSWTDYVALMEQVQPEWIVLGVLAAGLLLQGIMLRRCLRRDRENAERLLSVVAASLSGDVKGLKRDLEDAKQAQQEAADEVRRALSWVELRRSTGGDLPREGSSGLDKKRQVVSLAQKGLDPAEISQRLRIYRGETELVLGLRDYVSNGRDPRTHSAVQ